MNQGSQSQSWVSWAGRWGRPDGDKGVQAPALQEERCRWAASAPCTGRSGPQLEVPQSRPVETPKRWWAAYVRALAQGATLAAAALAPQGPLELASSSLWLSPPRPQLLPTLCCCAPPGGLPAASMPAYQQFERVGDCTASKGAKNVGRRNVRVPTTLWSRPYSVASYQFLNAKCMRAGAQRHCGHPRTCGRPASAPLQANRLHL